MNSYVDLSAVRPVAPVYTLVPTFMGHNLKCSLFKDDPVRQIAVEVLKEKEPQQNSSQRRRSLTKLFATEDSIPVTVTIQGEKVRLSISVKEVVERWKVPVEVVQELCDDGSFETVVARSPLLTERQSMSVGTTDSPPDHSSVSSDVDDLVPVVSLFKIDDGKEAEQPSKPVLDGFPFQQLKTYLKPNDRLVMGRVLQDHWLRVTKYIRTNQPAWIKHCEEEGLRSYYIDDKEMPFPLEFFHHDFSTCIYVPVNNTQLALNLETGVLCRYVPISKEESVKYLQIQQLARRCPHIQYHAVSSLSKLDGSIAYHFLVPLYAQTFEEALKAEVITNEDRDLFVEEWLMGLEALHAAGITHFGIGSKALLIHTDPKKNQICPVIGHFSQAFFSAEPPDQMSVTAAFQQFMPPECRQNDAFQQFVKVPKNNSMAVDMYQIGCCLQMLYHDLFAENIPVPSDGTIMFRNPPRKSFIVGFFAKLEDKSPFIRRMDAKRALRYWQEMPDS